MNLAALKWLLGKLLEDVLAETTCTKRVGQNIKCAWRKIGPQSLSLHVQLQKYAAKRCDSSIFHGGVEDANIFGCKWPRLGMFRHSGLALGLCP